MPSEQWTEQSLKPVMSAIYAAVLLARTDCSKLVMGLLFASAVVPAFAQQPATVEVDFAQLLGPVRALHGVNGGPLCDGEMVDLTNYWKQAGIPSTRLHDCDWPRPDVVDFHALFPNPDADPSLPESYTFQKTNDYLESVKKSGAEIVFRLGESIEHTKKKYHVHPPRDPAKWAAACCGIIRHYNAGWANGFQHGIVYWEIWNEPENRPAMWTGTDEQFIEFYAVVAKAIKKEFPDLKVGGPSVGATGEIVGGQWKRTEFLDKFLEMCRRDEVPLDFFSWHTYSNDPSVYAKKAKAIRAWLDDKGFQKTEQHLNEWNYLPNNDWSAFDIRNQGVRREKFFAEMAGPNGAGYLAYALCNLQDSPVDVSNIYAGNNGGFGLFSQHGTPKAAYYGVQLFEQLHAGSQRVAAKGGQPRFWTAAASLNENKQHATVLLAATQLRAPVKLEVVFHGLPQGKEWKGKLTVIGDQAQPVTSGLVLDAERTRASVTLENGVSLIQLTH